MKNTFHKKGFTLIELLVVIVILGILSTISVGTFRSYFAKARDSERVSAVQNVAMMIKVGTGGDGGCTVYNLDTGVPVAGARGVAKVGSLTNCAGMKKMEDLMLENDYRMPVAKSGLSYFYAYKVGLTEGDNEFVVMVAAEEDDAQNGKQLYLADGSVVTNQYIFIDGTRLGMDEWTGKDGVVSAPFCLWNVADEVPNTCAGWIINPINVDGSLGATLT